MYNVLSSDVVGTTLSGDQMVQMGKEQMETPSRGRVGPKQGEPPNTQARNINKVCSRGWGGVQTLLPRGLIVNRYGYPTCSADDMRRLYILSIYIYIYTRIFGPRFARP